jgi:hypothetical protein
MLKDESDKHNFTIPFNWYCTHLQGRTFSYRRSKVQINDIQNRSVQKFLKTYYNLIHAETEISCLEI